MYSSAGMAARTDGADRRGTRTLTALAPLVAAALVIGVLLWATPSDLRSHPLSAAASIGDVGPAAAVTIVVALLAWATACRVVLGSALLLLARCLPGLAGRACRRVGRTLTPRIIRGSIEALVGVALVTTGAGVPAALATPPPADVATTAPVPAPSVAPPPPALTLRLDRPAVGDRGASAALDRPRGGAVELDRRRRRTEPRHDSRGVAAAVTVRTGDTLWDIARRHLPAGADAAAIADAWPRWYAANRHVIGPDADLLRPGQRLVPPPARHMPSWKEAP
jgi:resuscitation-promoting factor RpfA